MFEGNDGFGGFFLGWMGMSMLAVVLMLTFHDDIDAAMDGSVQRGAAVAQAQTQTPDQLKF